MNHTQTSNAASSLAVDGGLSSVARGMGQLNVCFCIGNMNNYDHNPPSLTLLHLRNLDSTADYKLVQALSRYCVKDPSQLLDDKASVFASQGFPGLL